MFAGPNGSGKSTLKNIIPADLLGVYINADDIEDALRSDGISLSAYRIRTSLEEITRSLENSSLRAKTPLNSQMGCFRLENNILHLVGTEANSYHAAAIAAFFRQKLLEKQISFTFETVMSFVDKVEFLAQARAAGCRTYLYYIATETPEINISRVLSRVRTGGHPVPEDKIISRYWRSLALLPHAIQNSDRSFIFDNSGEGQGKTWIAEITSGKFLEIKTDRIPAWFQKFVLDPLQP